MIRALTIIAAVAALAVSAAPASAGSPKANVRPPDSGSFTLLNAEVFELNTWTWPEAARSGGGARSVVTNNNDPDKLGRSILLVEIGIAP
jgi:hypothetical protein